MSHQVHKGFQSEVQEKPDVFFYNTYYVLGAASQVSLCINCFFGLV